MITYFEAAQNASGSVIVCADQLALLSGPGCRYAGSWRESSCTSCPGSVMVRSLRMSTLVKAFASSLRASWSFLLPKTRNLLPSSTSRPAA
jgi:hypothetical protein